MVTLTNGQVQEAVPVLHRLVMLKVPFRTALKMRKVIRQINEHLAGVEAERQKLLEEYADHDEAGKMVTKRTPEGLDEVQFAEPLKRQAFEAEYRALMDTAAFECEPFAVADLEKMEVTTADLLTLGELVAEE
jgi:hypothetical protein